MNPRPPLSLQELAHWGEGELAYLKRLNSTELIKNFPELAPLDADIELWGLFGASGKPLIFSNHPAKVLADARDQQLKTVPLH
ncbi:DUF1150 family protein [Bartonella sp. DGB2]|uniref:BQ00720 family protein n=1 Tax=Bartonella sp. DGB2 TaxID=3388426 RepID=UPI0039900AEF